MELSLRLPSDEALLLARLLPLPLLLLLDLLELDDDEDDVDDEDEDDDDVEDEDDERLLESDLDLRRDDVVTRCLFASDDDWSPRSLRSPLPLRLLL